METDTNTVSVEQTPSIDLVKTNGGVVDEDGNGADAGDQIVYTYQVTNDGNVTLFNVTLTDDQLGAITLSSGLTDEDNDGVADDLAVGAVAAGMATATLTQAQVDAGLVTNVATAKGTDPKDREVMETDTNTVSVEQTPSIGLVKTGTFQDENGNGLADVGETIAYTFTVTNDGNVTLTNITLSDPLIMVLGGPIASLAPGMSDSTTFTGEYAITQEDIEAGLVDNMATVTGEPPMGPPVTDPGDATVPLPAAAPPADKDCDCDDEIFEPKKDQPYIIVEGDTLYLGGTDGHDTFEFRGVDGDKDAVFLRTSLPRDTYVKIDGRQVDYFQWKDFYFDGLSKIVIVSLLGDEMITQDQHVHIDTLIKDSGGNTCIGLGNGDNRLCLADGFDSITTGDGNNCISTGDGGSSIRTGNGNNIIVAGDGFDNISTGSGNDCVEVGNGGSCFSTGAGDDSVTGGAGYDGGDLGRGNDFFDGGAGGSCVDGGNGNDTMIGGAGRDDFKGGNGKDVLLGLGFQDILNGGAGRDTVVGGGGNDIFVARDGRLDFLFDGDVEDSDGNTDLESILAALEGLTRGNVDTKVVNVSDADVDTFQASESEDVIRKGGNDLIG